MKRLSTSLVCLALLAPGGCQQAAEEEDIVNEPGGKGDDLNDLENIDTRGYEFVRNDAAFRETRDHAGAPLLATIWGRISEYSQEAPHVETATYDTDPDKGRVATPWLLHITKRFLTIHKAWAPSFEKMGLDACAPVAISDDWFEWRDEDGNFEVPDLDAEQCFLQKMIWFNQETEKSEWYRRTIEVSLPDYLTLDLDKPPGFPNGRVLNEQINSLMFAMAFLDQGGDCLRSDGEMEQCDLYTLWRREDFLKPQNDVPFFGAKKIGMRPASFPFLAPAHRDN